MRVLLTGAAGFVGEALLVELLKSPTVELVLCLSRSAVRSAATPEDGRVRWIHGDIRDTGWHDLVGRVDVVIHAAANASFGNDADHEAVNHGGTVLLLECAAKAGARHIVFLSTIGAVDRAPTNPIAQPLNTNSVPSPRSLYGQSKLRAERAVQASGIPCTIIRPAWVYGRGMRRGSHLSVLAAMARRHSAVSVFDWPGRVSLVHVNDLCRAVAKVAIHGECIGQIMYAATESVSLGKIFATFGTAYGFRTAGAVPVPAAFGRGVVSRLHRALPLTVANLFVDYLTCETHPFLKLIAPEGPLLFSTRYEDVLQTIDPLRKKWLITGAGSGIGRSLAHLLSRRGVQVIGVDRCFEDSAPLPIQRIVLDLTDRNAVSILRDIVARDDVGVVVNNAGVGFKGAFSELCRKQIDATFGVNMLFPVEFAHAIVPLLAQRRGSLVNVASSMAGVPLPGMSLYSASKGFLQTWSIGLAEELRDTVQVLTVAPTGTRTNFQRHAGVRGGQRSLLSPDVVAKAIVDAVIQGKSFRFIGSWPMRVALFAGGMLPLSMQTRLWGKLFGNLR